MYTTVEYNAGDALPSFWSKLMKAKNMWSQGNEENTTAVEWDVQLLKALYLSSMDAENESLRSKDGLDYNTEIRTIAARIC